MGGDRQLHRVHPAVFPVVEISIHQGKAEIPHCRIGGNRAVLYLRLRVVYCVLPDGAVNVLDGVRQLLLQGDAFDGVNIYLLPAILGVFGGESSQHHFWVGDEIVVDRKPFRVFPKMYPVQLLDRGGILFLEEKDVGDHLGPGVSQKGVSGQSDGPQQHRPFCQIPAGLRALGVHGVPRGDKGHHPAGAQLVQGLGKKVVVDRKAQTIIPLIYHLEVAKGNISYCGVKKAVREISLFKSLDSDRVFLIELLGDTPGDGVQFHAI